MFTANRYLVVWESSVLGRKHESKHRRSEAVRLLEKREGREHFERGVVIDMADYTQDPDDFLQFHRDAAPA